MTVLATPTPYLRNGLRRLVAGLRKDAETVHLNLAQAEQDVAAARALLAEAEAQHQRAKDAADALAREIAFFEEQAERTPPAYDPDAALAATGLMPRDDDGPVSATLYQDNGLPMIWDASIPPGGYVCAVYETAGGPGIDMPNGTRICGTPVESEPCDRHRRPADDDLVASGAPVKDSRAEVAPHLPPPVPHDPFGAPVATSGPLMTMPDLGPAREPLDPPPGEGVHRHAKDRPGLFARLTGGHRIIHDEQDGDADA